MGVILKNIFDIFLIISSIILIFLLVDFEISCPQLLVKFPAVVDFLPIFNTFIGASLAFLFALWMYHYQAKLNNAAYLSYVITIFSDLIGSSYKLKKQILIDRIPHIEKIKNELNKPVHEHFDVGHLSLHIFNGPNLDLINLEKLAFLAKYDPNIICLLKSAIEANYNNYEIINACNIWADNFKKNKTFDDLIMLVSVNENLQKQTDDTINLAEKSFEVLVNFSRVHFKKLVKIKGFEFIDKSYEALKPAPIESWERYNWKPN